MKDYEFNQELRRRCKNRGIDYGSLTAIIDDLRGTRTQAKRLVGLCELYQGRFEALANAIAQIKKRRSHV